MSLAQEIGSYEDGALMMHLLRAFMRRGRVLLKKRKDNQRCLSNMTEDSKKVVMCKPGEGPLTRN